MSGGKLVCQGWTVYEKGSENNTSHIYPTMPLPYRRHITRRIFSPSGLNGVDYHAIEKKLIIDIFTLPKVRKKSMNIYIGGKSRIDTEKRDCFESQDI